MRKFEFNSVIGRWLGVGVGAVVLGLAGTATLPMLADAHDELPAHHVSLPEHATQAMRRFWEDTRVKQNLDPMVNEAVEAPFATCSGGAAGGFPCSNVDLQSFLPMDLIGGTSANSAINDIWGWTSPSSGREFAIVGRVFGTSFVDITNPANPVYVGNLPTHGAFGSSWRDMKTYANHAFIVSEASNHGMQVFDLTQLDAVLDAGTPLPVSFTETAHYSGAASSHNIAINEETGFAYIVGAARKNSCSGGLHMVDIINPASPTFAGCYSGDGYTHDVQCVVYDGPDTAYTGQEICFASNEDSVTIVDVTDKSNPIELSRTTYAGSAYTHQGWLSHDHSQFVFDDELDEQSFLHNTRTRVLDVSDLDAPGAVVEYESANRAIDHNLYMVGVCAVQANYRSGLQIVDFRDVIENGGTAAVNIGSFDVWPSDDDAEFNGAWSNYPYFASGNIIISGIEQGLFVVTPVLPGGASLADYCAPTTDPVDPNEAPVVSILSPTEPAVFNEGDTITFSASATDPEGDVLDLAALEWSDEIGLLGTGSPFDFVLPVGEHVISASIADSLGKVGSDSILVVVNAVGGGSDMWLSGLSGLGVPDFARRYTAEVTVEVSSGGGLVDGAVVEGSWSGGAKGGGSCTTDATGTCVISKSVKLGNVAAFTVNDITAAGLAYDPLRNTVSDTVDIISP